MNNPVAAVLDAVLNVLEVLVSVVVAKVAAVVVVVTGRCYVTGNLG